MNSGIEFPVVRRGLALHLISPAFQNDFLDIPEGVDLIVARPRQARSLTQLNWYWAVLSEICKSGAWDGDQESLSDYIKMRTNFGKWYPLSTGQAMFIPRSIAMYKCDQGSFNAYILAMEECLATHLGIDVGAVFAIAEKIAPRPSPEEIEPPKHDLELTAEHVETKAIEPPPKQLPAPVSTRPDDSLEDRLMMLAIALDATNLIAVNKKWATLRQRADIKALWKEAGPAVEKIKTAAQEHAKGELDRRRFNEAVERAVDSVAQRWRAA